MLSSAIMSRTQLSKETLCLSKLETVKILREKGSSSQFTLSDKNVNFGQGNGDACLYSQHSEALRSLSSIPAYSTK